MALTLLRSHLILSPNEEQRLLQEEESQKRRQRLLEVPFFSDLSQDATSDDTETGNAKHQADGIRSGERRSSWRRSDGLISVANSISICTTTLRGCRYFYTYDFCCCILRLRHHTDALPSSKAIPLC